MKNSILSFLLLLVFTNWTLAQDSDCSRITSFGESNICLPVLEGYQECYLDSAVKPIIDAIEPPSNMTLGFYLSNAAFEKRDSMGRLSIDNYFKVYGIEQMRDYEVDRQILKQIQNVFTQNFISKNWELVENEIDKIELELKIGVPTLVKSYSKNEDSFTYVLLTKNKPKDGQPSTLAMTMNVLLINKRLVMMTYYLGFKGEETMYRLQENSDLILLELQNKNK